MVNFLLYYNFGSCSLYSLSCVPLVVSTYQTGACNAVQEQSTHTLRRQAQTFNPVSMRLTDLEAIQWSAHWQPITNDVERQFLSSELMTELHAAHPLAGLVVMAVARRIDSDNVLFAVRGSPSYLAVVHLTFAEEHSPNYPAFQVYASIDAWLQAEKE
jgi:hypothetical protein